MTYAVHILRTAQKQLSKLDVQAQARIISSIRQLGADPRPPGCKKLVGRAAWRIRTGPHRVIYEIHDDRLLVLVVTIGNRRDIYR